MSGDTSTCKVHLDGAFRLMRYARSWKTKYSAKARSLHRIYFYLRTIYESTSVDDADREHASPESDVAVLNVSDPPTPPVGHNALDPFAFSSMARDESSPATTTWEIIYGVPLSLLVLLSRTTQLIKRLSALRKSRGTTDDPPELAEQCDMLEMSIMDFPSDDLTAQERDEETPNARIIRKTTIAFHHALIIYFAQNVRLLGHRYLQPYVLAVLSSIREIESIKDEKQILAAPLFWPAFIAASEAFDPATQAEFKGWYRQVEVYCIEAARTGTMVLERLWKNGPATGVRYTSQWMALVERTGVDLMLS